MAYSVGDGNPSIDEVIGSSIADSLDLCKKNVQPASVAIVLAGLLGIYLVFTKNVSSPSFAFACDICIIALVVVEFYAFAAAVRTINPAYRMTVGQFLGFLGYALLVGLITVVAGFFLIIPAFWVGVKLQLTQYTYIVTNGAPGALARTWNMTTGYYWPTLGFLIMVAVVAGVAGILAEIVAIAAAINVPVLTVVTFPLAIALLIWAVHFEALAYVRWTSALLPRAEPENAVVTV